MMSLMLLAVGLLFLLIPLVLGLAYLGGIHWLHSHYLISSNELAIMSQDAKAYGIASAVSGGFGALFGLAILILTLVF